MPIVTEDLRRPDGSAPQHLAARFYLAGTRGQPIEGYADDGTLVGSLALTPDEDGEYEVDLVPNSSITPSGTRWRRDLVSGRDVVSSVYLLVPAGPGPWRVDEVLSEPPGVVVAPDTAAILAAAVADLQAIVADLVVSAGVLSVNTDPGPHVVLDAADVGAMATVLYDPTGVEANVFDAANLAGVYDAGTF